VIWGVSALLLAAWLTWFSIGRVTVFDVSQSARIEAGQSARQVAALMSGRVMAAPVAVGQSVKTGDVLLELDADQQRLRAEEETVRSAALPSRIATLEAEIAEMSAARQADQSAAAQAASGAAFRGQEARARADFAAENARRMAEDARSGSISRMEAQRAESQAQELAAAYDALQAEVRRLKSDLQSRDHAAGAQIAARRLELVGLRNDAATSGVAQARLSGDVDRRVIRSPVDGRIGDLAPLKVGAFVTEGQTVASVVPGGSLMIVALFEPSAVQGRLRPGQRARVGLDGYPWTQFGQIDAVVRTVATDIRDGHLRVELDPVLSPNAVRLLKHGLLAHIEVEVEQVSPVDLVLRSVAGRPGRS
jgi:membrane fusion protein (multidrug efflux system)